MNEELEVVEEVVEEVAEEVVETPPEPPKFSGKLESILPNGNVIYDGVEGKPSDFPLTEAEIIEVNNP